MESKKNNKKNNGVCNDFWSSGHLQFSYSRNWQTDRRTNDLRRRRAEVQTNDG